MAYPIAVEYIKKTRKDGFADGPIRSELEKAGWPAVEIDKAFEEANKPAAAPTILDVKRELPVGTARQQIAQQQQQPRFVSRENVLESAIRKSDAVPAPMVLPQKKKSFAFVAAAIFLVIALGAGAGGFVYYHSQILPKRVVEAALQKFKTMKTYRYEAELVISEKNSSGRLIERTSPFLPPFANVLLHAYSSRNVGDVDYSNVAGAFKIYVKGASDKRDESNIKHEAALTLGTRVVPEIGSNIEMAMKLVGGTYYFQFSKLPPFDSTAIIGYGLPRFTEQDFVGKWASFNPTAFGESYNSYIAQLADIDPSFAGLRMDFSGTADLITKNEQEKIRELWEESSFISWDKEIFSEDLRGAPAYRVKGTLNRSEIARFFESASAVTGGANTEIGKDELGKILETFGDVEFNIWVDKSGSGIIKTIAHAVVAESPEIVSSGTAELLFSIDFSDADEDVVIESPSGAYDFGKILDGIFAGTLDDVASVSIDARDARRIRDLAAIQKHLKTYVERNARYPKTLDELVPEYMADMPRDPKSGKLYRYELKTKSRYVLSAELENRQHPVLLRDTNTKNALYDVTENDL